MTCGEGACARWAAQQPQEGQRVLSVRLRGIYWGRFATQREQAPSPQFFRVSANGAGVYA